MASPTNSNIEPEVVHKVYFVTQELVLTNEIYITKFNL